MAIDAHWYLLYATVVYLLRYYHSVDRDGASYTQSGLAQSKKMTAGFMVATSPGNSVSRRSVVLLGICRDTFRLHGLKDEYDQEPFPLASKAESQWLA